MTIDRGFAPPTDRRRPGYVRCARCNVLQPPSPAGQYRCVACGAPLQRWVAHPPPGGPTAPVTRTRPPEQRYLGPPAYRGGHPQWSFGPMVWHEIPPAGDADRGDDPANALRWVGWVAAVTAVAALVAAGAEIWRFSLMIQGRTLVLSGAVVRASDVLVAITALAVGALALLTAMLAIPTLVRTHAAAARRIGRAPSRRPRDIVLRLLVPGWNVYGAGQIVTEIDRTLDQLRVAAQDEEGEIDAANPVSPRAVRRQAAHASTLTIVWWISWIISAGLIAAALLRGLGGSLQAIADTVELHIAVDLVAAVVAGLGAVIAFRFAGLLTDRPSEFDSWVVQPPEPTRPA